MATKKASQEELVAAALRAGRLSVKEAAALLEGIPPRVRLNGRFPAGAKVHLVRVAPGATSAAGGEVVDTQTVDKESQVTFEKNVEANWPYYVVGEIDGVEREVSVRGKVPAGRAELSVRPSTVAARPLHRSGGTEVRVSRDEEDRQNRRRAAKRASGRAAKTAALESKKAGDSTDSPKAVTMSTDTDVEKITPAKASRATKVEQPDDTKKSSKK